jgi:hypothetical protein
MENEAISATESLSDNKSQLLGAIFVCFHVAYSFVFTCQEAAGEVSVNTIRNRRFVLPNETSLS